MKERFIFFLILGIDACVLYLESLELSIGYHEAELLYLSDTLLKYVLQGSLGFFGHSDFALRLPMILTHLASAVLLYAIAGRYVRYERDRLWLLLIYVLLPGVSSAALLVDNAGFVIMLLFLYYYVCLKNRYAANLLLLLFLPVDVSFAFLYLGLFFYGLYTRNNPAIVYTLLLFTASMYLHGFDTGGLPKGHLLDTLGIYATIFSPIVFVYLVYVLYRRFVLKELDLMWFLAMTPLLFSLLLSLRQPIEVQMFAPYLMLAMPLAAQSFFHSYRVRLRIYRKQYRRVFVLSFVLLCINALVVFFNKEIYRFLDDTSSHFAYRFHVARDLAEELTALEIDCVDANDKKLQLRLRFYGIGACDTYSLGALSEEKSQSVTVSYSDVVLYQGYVTKVNK